MKGFLKIILRRAMVVARNKHTMKPNCYRLIYSAIHCCLGNRIRGKLLQVLSSYCMQSSKLGCQGYLAADCLRATQSLSLPTQLLAQAWIHPSSKLSSLEWWGSLQIRSTRPKALCSWPYYSKFACH